MTGTPSTPDQVVIVMTQILEGTEADTAPTRQSFIEVVCGDEDLLRAEFDAIIAAGWPDPPPRPPAGVGAGKRPAGNNPCLSGDRHHLVDPSPRWVGVLGRARARAPPANPR